jgi:hypothetical protein
MPDEDVSAAPVDAGTPAVDSASAPPEQNWLLSMPEDLQNDATLNQYKTTEEAMRGFIETKRMVGDRVKVPDETATPEDLAKFYSRLGRPETPAGYEFTQVELPATMPIDEGVVNAFKAKAHELGLTKKQADGVYVDYLNNLKSMNDKILTDYDTGMKAQLEVLQNRWGDQFETNKSAAINTFKSFAPPALQATVEREGWGNNPDFVELFHNIAKATGEDTMRPTGSQSAFSSLDDQIKAIDRQLFDSPEGAPGRTDLIKKRDALYNERYPQRER